MAVAEKLCTREGPYPLTICVCGNASIARRMCVAESGFTAHHEKTDSIEASRTASTMELKMRR